jgi:predicted SpoU family rRNA methylase
MYCFFFTDMEQQYQENNRGFKRGDMVELTYYGQNVRGVIMKTTAFSIYVYDIHTQIKSSKIFKPVHVSSTYSSDFKYVK